MLNPRPLKRQKINIDYNKIDIDNNIDYNNIDYITFASTGNATDAGDLTIDTAAAGGCSGT